MHYLHNEIVNDLEHARVAREAELFHRRLEAIGEQPHSLRRDLRGLLRFVRGSFSPRVEERRA